MLKKKFVAVVLGMLLAFNGFSQMVSSKTFRLLKNESFSEAEKFSLSQIKKYSSYTSSRKVDKLLSAYYSLGTISFLKGDLSASEKYYLVADSIATYLTGVNYFKDHYLNIKDELAAIKLQEGHIEEAGRLLRQNYNIRLNRYNKENPFAFRNKNNSYKYRSDQFLGQYYVRRQLPDSALFYYERHILALRNTPNPKTTDLNRLADCYQQASEITLDKGNTNYALKLAKKGYRINKHYWTKKSAGKNNFNKIASANQVAECYLAKGDLKHSLKWNEKAYDRYLNKVKEESKNKLALLISRGKIYWAMDSMALARTYFKEASDRFISYVNSNFIYLSEYEREYFYHTNRYHLEIIKAFYYDYLSKNNFENPTIIKELYEVNLNTKGILLNSSAKLIDQVYASTDTSVLKKFQELKRLKNQLSYRLQTSEIGTQQQWHSEIIEAIDFKEKELRQILKIGKDQYVTMEQVLSAVQDSTQLIDILRCPVYKKKYTKQQRDSVFVYAKSASPAYLYFVSDKIGEQMICRSIGTGDELENRFYTLYQNSIKFEITDSQLYDAYFKVLEKDLLFKKLVVVSDGIYSLINMNTLFDGTEYLLHRYDLYSVISAKELLKRKNTLFAIKDIILFGRPDFDDYTDPPADLPGTEQEVNSILALTQHKLNGTLYLGKNADEYTVKNIPSASVIHFATHGYFGHDSNVNSMLASGLLFSKSDSLIDQRQIKEDGLLTAYEASGLNLSNTQLVVLSACETGQGKFSEGEGVWGLQRAFQVAGVNYIIMSLFKVNDAVSAHLMKKFYQYIIEGNKVYPAFKMAQEDIRKEYPAPKYWGSFILKGY